LGTMTINGKTYQGNSIDMINGTVFIDGKIAEEAETANNHFEIKIEGSLSGGLRCQGNITVKGDVIGDVDCNSLQVGGNIKGDIDCNSINCGDVTGKIDANSLICGKHNKGGES